MRAAIYHRVSTLDQNPDAARDELRAHAARLGGEVVLEVQEVASGGKNDRAGLRKVLAAARRGQLDAVLVWKLDRWGRSTLDVLANIEALKTAGVRFICTSQSLDVKPGGDAMSQLILTVMSGVAEFERSLIRERTLLGLARAKKQGRVGGRPRKYDLDGAAVKALRDAGKSWSQVAAELGCRPEVARRAVARLAAEPTA